MITELQAKRLDYLARRIQSLPDHRIEELMSNLAALTPNEVAEACGVHPETVRRWLREGQLRGAKIGHEYRISRREVSRFWRERGGGELFEEQDSKAADIARGVIDLTDHYAEGDNWHEAISLEAIVYLAAAYLGEGND